MDGLETAKFCSKVLSSSPVSDRHRQQLLLFLVLLLHYLLLDLKFVCVAQFSPAMKRFLCRTSQFHQFECKIASEQQTNEWHKTAPDQITSRHLTLNILTTNLLDKLLFVQFFSEHFFCGIFPIRLRLGAVRRLLVQDLLR